MININNKEIEDAIADDSTSYRAQDYLRKLLTCDPVDAVNEAEHIFKILERRLKDHHKQFENWIQNTNR